MLLAPPPSQLFDKDGKPLGSVRPGDTVYRRIDGRLVAGVVVTINPMQVRS